MSERLCGIMAEFETPDELTAGLHAARSAGYTRFDAYAPFPMPGLAHVFNPHPIVLPLVALAAAMAGGILQYYAQYWMNAVDYPLNVGGRPLHSWPAFIPATIIVAVLWAGASTLLAMLVLIGLPRLHHPVFGVPGFERASEDRFFLFIAADDPLFEPTEVADMLTGTGACTVHEVPP